MNRQQTPVHDPDDVSLLSFSVHASASYTHVFAQQLIRKLEGVDPDPALRRLACLQDEEQKDPASSPLGGKTRSSSEQFNKQKGKPHLRPSQRQHRAKTKRPPTQAQIEKRKRISEYAKWRNAMLKRVKQEKEESEIKAAQEAEMESLNFDFSKLDPNLSDDWDAALERLKHAQEEKAPEAVQKAMVEALDQEFSKLNSKLSDGDDNPATVEGMALPARTMRDWQLFGQDDELADSEMAEQQEVETEDMEEMEWN
ncbi:hypothetical protein MBLNU459_g1993t1 [Dothideomycetes sp. NU459]